MKIKNEDVPSCSLDKKKKIKELNGNNLSTQYHNKDLNKSTKKVGEDFESPDLKPDSGIEEDQAESVDSGCVADLPQETCWDQVGLALNYEYNFVLGLLRHTSIYKNEEQSALNPNNQLSKVTGLDKKTQLKLLQTQKENSAKALANNSKKRNDTKRKLEEELRKLRKHRPSNLTLSQANHKENKIRKQILILEKQRKKEVKKGKREDSKVIPSQSEMATSAEEARKIYNKCGKLVFSKFDFSDSVKDKWNDNRKPDLNNFLSKVIKEKEKINSLKSKGKVDEASKFMERKTWDQAMKRANGEKVKDNHEKLSKSLSRTRNKKNKSKAKWAERERVVKQDKEERQEKRSKNIKERKQSIAAKKNKRGKAKKKAKGKGKGTHVPGF